MPAAPQTHLEHCLEIVAGADEPMTASDVNAGLPASRRGKDATSACASLLKLANDGAIQRRRIDGKWYYAPLGYNWPEKIVGAAPPPAKAAPKPPKQPEPRAAVKESLTTAPPPVPHTQPAGTEDTPEPAAPSVPSVRRALEQLASRLHHPPGIDRLELKVEVLHKLASFTDDSIAEVLLAIGRDLEHAAGRY